MYSVGEVFTVVQGHISSSTKTLKFAFTISQDKEMPVVSCDRMIVVFV